MFAIAENGFIVCLGVILLIGGLIVYYVKQKLDFLERKIGSMFQIITALTNEVSSIHGGKPRDLSHSNDVEEPHSSNSLIKENEGNLIEVSDNEEEFSEDSDDSDENLTSDEEEENTLNISDEQNIGNIKVIEMDLSNENSLFNPSLSQLKSSIYNSNNSIEEINDEDLDLDSNIEQVGEYKKINSGSSENIDSVENVESSEIPKNVEDSEKSKTNTEQNSENLDQNNIEINNKPNYKKLAKELLRDLVKKKENPPKNIQKLKKDELIKILETSS